MVYYPTLSELIEACGEDFEYFIRVCGDTKAETRGYTAHAFGEMTGDGPTPEEAVARLYLALNDK